MAKQKEFKEVNNTIRLDKWLWAARFYKTRTIAKEMIDGGKVHYNSQRTKPNKNVEIGALINLRQGNEEKEVVVLSLSEQRRGAAEAQLLYQETQTSIEKRERLAAIRRNSISGLYTECRPNKKERRDLLKFKYQS